MEDTLRDVRTSHYRSRESLNPCFNGRYSQSEDSAAAKSKRISLNPCFNGRYSQSSRDFKVGHEIASLNPCFNGRYSQRGSTNSYVGIEIVLILVLMEDTLRVRK